MSDGPGLCPGHGSNNILNQCQRDQEASDISAMCDACGEVTLVTDRHKDATMDTVMAIPK